MSRFVGTGPKMNLDSILTNGGENFLDSHFTEKNWYDVQLKIICIVILVFMSLVILKKVINS